MKKIIISVFIVSFTAYDLPIVSSEHQIEQTPKEKAKIFESFNENDDESFTFETFKKLMSEYTQEFISLEEKGKFKIPLVIAVVPTPSENAYHFFVATNLADFFRKRIAEGGRLDTPIDPMNREPIRKIYTYEYDPTLDPDTPLKDHFKLATIYDSSDPIHNIQRFINRMEMHTDKLLQSMDKFYNSRGLRGEYTEEVEALASNHALSNRFRNQAREMVSTIYFSEGRNYRKIRNFLEDMFKDLQSDEFPVDKVNVCRFILGYIYYEGLEGVPQDLKKVKQLFGDFLNTPARDIFRDLFDYRSTARLIVAKLLLEEPTSSMSHAEMLRYTMKIRSLLEQVISPRSGGTRKEKDGAQTVLDALPKELTMLEIEAFKAKALEAISACIRKYYPNHS